MLINLKCLIYRHIPYGVVIMVNYWANAGKYLGDIHDFFKFHFLKFLSKKINKKIRLNWYLVDPKKIGNIELNKNDGEKRKYLIKAKYLNLDQELKNESQKG